MHLKIISFFFSSLTYYVLLYYPIHFLFRFFLQHKTIILFFRQFFPRYVLQYISSQVKVIGTYYLPLPAIFLGPTNMNDNRFELRGTGRLHSLLYFARKILFSTGRQWPWINDDNDWSITYLMKQTRPLLYKTTNDVNGGQTK